MQKKELTEQERIAILRKQKIRRDAKDLKAYRKRLEQEKLTYRQTFCMVAINQRREREAAIGKCALEAIEKIKELRDRKSLVPGSLYFALNEEKIKDPYGKKGYKYSVEFCVTSYEDAHSKEDIDKEIESTFEKMMAETDELFPAEVKDSSLRSE